RTRSATASKNITINSFDGLAPTSKSEHSSGFNTYKNENYKEVRHIANDRYGFIDEEDLRNKLDKDVNFVSFIYVNNEIGTIQNIKKLTKIIKDFNKDIVIHRSEERRVGKERKFKM